jgi:hypothetical protein
MGGLIYEESADIENAYVYDMTSAYPAAMSSTITFPMAEGTFELLDEIPLSYGLFRVKIEGPSQNCFVSIRNIFTPITI